MISFKKWVVIYLLPLFIISAIPTIYLSAIYENNKFQDVVTRQLKNKSIYGTALNQNTYGYKFALVEQVKPTVLAFGSSRVMQFREESFIPSFANSGGAMNSLTEGIKFIKEMDKSYTPDYVILGVDIWWFNENRSEPTDFAFNYHLNNGDKIYPNKLFKTLKYLQQGKLNPNTVKYIFNNGFISNAYTGHDNLGITAIEKADGFRHDGSRLYGARFFGLDGKDQGFTDSLNRIKKGNERFEYGNNTSDQGKSLFLELLNEFDKKGIKVLAIVPPMANRVHQKLINMGDHYNYIPELFSWLESLPIKVYNYHDISKLTTDDCEFIDGFHGGDVVFQRILLDIASKNTDFAKVLNLEGLSYNIKQYKGRALSLIRTEEQVLPEIDFLSLGCEKSVISKDNHAVF